jgi:hypothetical protein
MRAKEFVVEQRATLAPEYADPMRFTYTIPELKTSDVYSTYRFSVALARARAEMDPDAVFDQQWTTETAFSNQAVVSGFDSSIAHIIDKGLTMLGKSTKKELISSPPSEEPDFVSTQSPIKAFKGYTR